MVRFVPILLIASVSSLVQSLQVMFEGFSGCESNGVVECALRVRKINRTTAALKGNLTLLTDLDESFSTQIDGYHSPLGNNQFTRYPMKIGPIPFCDFMRNFWADYRPFLAKYVDNLAQPGECPMSVRMLFFNDMQLEAEMFPPYVPRGLWKLQWNARNERKHLTAEILFKVYENGHF